MCSSSKFFELKIMQWKCIKNKYSVSKTRINSKKTIKDTILVKWQKGIITDQYYTIEICTKFSLFPEKTKKNWDVDIIYLFIDLF